MLIVEFLVKRLAQGVLIVALTSLIIFTVLRITPTDPARLIVGGMAPDNVVEEIATKIHMHPTTVRRELSERVYEFLELISGRPVSNRFMALRVLQEYGVIEYVLPPPSSK